MRIVVNADDFGMTHEKNLAIDEMMRYGICTNTSLVVNTPYTDEAVKMAFDGGYSNQISLHINLTVGEALSEKIKKKNLYYNGNEFAYNPIIKKYRQIFPLNIGAVREEIDTQIKKFQSYGLQLNSIDSHNWVHLRIPVWFALRPLIKKYNIKIVRPMWKGYRRDEIASKRWSRYFRRVEPIILKCPQCKVFSHTSNIEQLLLVKDQINNYEFVEVFTHPDIIDGRIIDTSSSYTKQKKKTVEDNVKQLAEYEFITIQQILEDM